MMELGGTIMRGFSTSRLEGRFLNEVRLGWAGPRTTSPAFDAHVSPYWYIRGVTPHCRIRDEIKGTQTNGINLRRNLFVEQSFVKLAAWVFHEWVLLRAAFANARFDPVAAGRIDL
jgi:hypothetical protein